MIWLRTYIHTLRTTVQTVYIVVARIILYDCSLYNSVQYCTTVACTTVYTIVRATRVYSVVRATKSKVVKYFVVEGKVFQIIRVAPLKYVKYEQRVGIFHVRMKWYEGSCCLATI
jgi:hypothetical protein